MKYTALKVKITGILLFCALTVPVLATFTGLQLLKNQVRKAVKQHIIQGIDREELVLLAFTQAEQQQLTWEHDHEFEYNHSMYDIVTTETKGDTTFYWCWWDNKESRLNQQLRDLLAYAFAADPQNQEQQKRLAQFFQSIFHSSIATWNTPALLVVTLQSGYDLNYLAPTPFPSTPPPDRV